MMGRGGVMDGALAWILVIVVLAVIVRSCA